MKKKESKKKRRVFITLELNTTADLGLLKQKLVWAGAVKYYIAADSTVTQVQANVIKAERKA